MLKKQCMLPVVLSPPRRPVARRLLLGAAGFVLSTFSAPGGDQWSPPANYYASVKSISGAALKSELADVIGRNYTFYTYGNITNFINAVDTHPDDPDSVQLIYSGLPLAKGAFGTIEDKTWNREHLWPQSYGADTYSQSGTYPANSDIHHLYPALVKVNSTRSNKIFDWTGNNPKTIPEAPGCTFDGDSWEPRDADKGRIARAILYMDVRYDGRDASGDLRLSDVPDYTRKTFGKLSTLLEWNRLFPPDDYERRRNHQIHTGVTWGVATYKQGNRNPFTDYPDLADAIYTANQSITRGSWRIAHFTLAEIDNPAISAWEADPDGDGLPNLAELAIGTDPLTVTDPFASVNWPNLGSVYYYRLKNAASAYLDYQLQGSADPYDPASWATISGTSSKVAEGLLEKITLNDTEAHPQKIYRLVVSSTHPHLPEQTAIIDPVAGQSPEGSLFRYEANALPKIKNTWMGYVFDGFSPWCFSFTQGWWYAVGNRPEAFWAFDLAFGWIFTGKNYFPFVFHAGSGRWYYYTEGESPHRQFYDPIAEKTFHESSL